MSRLETAGCRSGILESDPIRWNFELWKMEDLSDYFVNRRATVTETSMAACSNFMCRDMCLNSMCFGMSLNFK